MTCMNALELMLDAEPAELSLEGDSALVAHLRTCAKCRAVAAQLAMDTASLATVVASRPMLVASAPDVPRARGLRVRPIAVAGSLAAAAVVLFLVWPVPEPEPVVPVPVPVKVPAVAVTVPVSPKRYAEAVAVAAAAYAPGVAVDTTVAPSVPGTVEVDAPPGVRTTVMRTKNPAITVVWLSKSN